MKETEGQVYMTQRGNNHNIIIIMPLCSAITGDPTNRVDFSSRMSQLLDFNGKCDKVAPPSRFSI